MKLAKRLVVAGFASLTFALALVAGVDAQRDGGRSTVTVRIATPRTAGAGIIYLAQNYAKKRGLNLTYSSAFTFADMQRDLTTGSVDASFLGYTNPASMADQGVGHV